MKIKIILADDHVVMRDALKILLERQDDFKIISVASDGREAIRLVEEYKPDIVVMDIEMPNLTGIEATKQIKSISPNTKILTILPLRSPYAKEKCYNF